MNRRIPIPIIIISIIFIILPVSCGVYDYNDVSSQETKDFQDYVLTSYYLLKDTQEPASLGISRAAFPAHTETGHTFVSLTSAATTLTDYPEAGQNTVFTVLDMSATLADLYKVTAVTSYPVWETDIVSFTETYYVLDDGDSVYDTDDQITDNTGAVDPQYREVFQADYADGSVRYYQLAETHASGDASGYAAFDINGSLTFPAGDWSPAAQTANWSSKVIYAQYFNKTWLFWRKENKILVGARYYTEHGTPTDPTKTSVSYERMVYLTNADTSNLKNNEKEAVADYIDYLFNGGSAPALLDSLTLAETVIRYQILPADGGKIIRQQTEVVNKFGEDFVFKAGTSTDSADPGNSVPVSF